MRMTTFIIGIILSVMVMTIFGTLLADSNDKYGSEYDADQMETFQKMDEINNLTTQIQNRVKNQSTDRSLSDVIGGFIADGKDTLLLSAKSYSMFESVGNEGLEKIHAPNIFNAVLTAIVLIVIFVGVILAAILGRRL